MNKKYIFGGLFLTLLPTFIQASDSSEYKYQAQIQVDQAGFFRLKVSPEIAGKSRSDLGDIRLLDSNSSDVPYLLQELREQETRTHNPRQVHVAVEEKETIVGIETGAGKEAIEHIIVQTPSNDFLKSVTLEGSQDKKNWKPLAVNEPIFSKNGCDKRMISISPSSWAYLRLRIRDDSDQRIPINGVFIQFAKINQVPHDVYPLQVKSETEGGGQTRIVVTLPSKNLFVSGIEITSDNDVYQRAISVNQPIVDGNEMIDSSLANGTVFKIHVPDGRTASENFVPVQQRILESELVVIINNGMSPALQRIQVKAIVIPSFVVFHSKDQQRIQFLTGNTSAEKPSYDLGFLTSQLQSNPSLAVPIASTRLQGNPQYKLKDVLPVLAELASPIDVSNWTYRKAIQISNPGVQELELDLETLALGENSFADLRIVQEEKQIPYLLWRYGNRHSFSPPIEPLKTDHKNESQYKIKLPHKRLTLDEISIQISDSLFERQVSLFEEVEDNRGSRDLRLINQTTWVKTPTELKSRFKIPLRFDGGRSQSSEYSPRLESDTLILVIQNRDNPPLKIQGVEAFYRSPKLVFKPMPGKEMWLYFGNKKADKPTYDIRLVKDELFESDKFIAQLGSKESLGPSEWWVLPSPKGTLKYIFWGVLGLITLLLILVIAKLLPAEKAIEGGENEG